MLSDTFNPKGECMKVSLKAVMCGIVLIAVGGVAFAGFANPDEAIRYRQAVMTVIGQHFGRLAAVVKGQAPYDKKDVEHNAVVIRTMAELPWDAVMFPGSAKGNTTLKGSALQEKDKFMVVARKLESATQKLAETAANDDPEAFKAQFGEVAGVCKTCHSTYRHK
jgi:cytochrome c556